MIYKEWDDFVQAVSREEAERALRRFCKTIGEATEEEHEQVYRYAAENLRTQVFQQIDDAQKEYNYLFPLRCIPFVMQLADLRAMDLGLWQGEDELAFEMQAVFHEGLQSARRSVKLTETMGLIHIYLCGEPEDKRESGYRCFQRAVEDCLLNEFKNIAATIPTLTWQQMHTIRLLLCLKEQPYHEKGFFFLDPESGHLPCFVTQEDLLEEKDGAAAARKGETLLSGLV